jgi:putrescine aminotransferase
MRFCSEDFLRGLRRICTDNDIILVFDEIYTGWGKTGSLFYFMQYPGLVPDILTTSKSFGGGKSSISAYIARTPVFRKAYDNLTDALVHSTSTTYYGFGEEAATAIEAINIVVEDDYPARARALEAVLAPGLARISKEYPEIVSGVCGAGALHGVFFDAGPRVLDLAAKLAPGGLAKDPRFRTKLVISSIVDALYRDHGIYAYYGLGGDNPLVVAPPLVAEPEQAEYFLECFEATLATGLTSLLTRFVREKVKSLW